jgi:uncharacterized membrane protein YfhO
MSNWVSLEVATERTVTGRMKKLWYFTLLAKELLALNNFFGAMQVLFLLFYLVGLWSLCCVL